MIRRFTDKGEKRARLPLHEPSTLYLLEKEVYFGGQDVACPEVLQSIEPRVPGG